MRHHWLFNAPHVAHAPQVGHHWCSQWCQFLNLGCVWVRPWTSSICGGIIYAVQDAGVIRCALYLWCSTWAVCAGACYTRCRDRTSVHLCVSSLQNLAVPHDFYSSVSKPVERSWWPRIRWCGTGGFQEQGKCIFIVLAARSPFVSYCFSFLIFHSMGWYCGVGVFGLIWC